MKGICHLIGGMGGEIRPNISENDYLIGVDAGYSQIKDWNLQANVVVGDFDSLGYVPEGETVVELPCKKDQSDMEYALNLGKQLGFTKYLLQGGIGGRMDHTFGNMQLLLQLAQEGQRGILIGEGQNITVIQEDSIKFPKIMQGYCSVFAISAIAEGVSLKNLAYSGDDFSLSPAIPLGVSNEFLEGKCAEISVKKGAIAIFWHGTLQEKNYREILMAH